MTNISFVTNSQTYMTTDLFRSKTLCRKGKGSIRFPKGDRIPKSAKYVSSLKGACNVSRPKECFLEDNDY